MRRLGIIGPSDGSDALEKVISFMLFDLQVNQAIYFGSAKHLHAAVDQIAKHISRNHDGEPIDFFDQIFRVALQGDPVSARELAKQDHDLRRLADVRAIPEQPAQVVQLMGSRVILIVRDIEDIDEDDKKNAFLVVSTTKNKSFLSTQNGMLHFCSGHLNDGEIAMIETIQGGLQINLFDPHGRALRSEQLKSAQAKVTLLP